MPRTRRQRDTSFDRLTLIDEISSVVDREEAGEVTVRWWTTNGRRFVEVSKVASWKPTSAETVLTQALERDRQWLATKGRHISAERLARDLRIGKPRALELVKQIRAKEATG